jgi:predicted anti-sigma-YlaC factor YlaD
MMSCHEVTELASQSLDRDLTLGERVALRIHEAMCSGCRNFERQLKMLREICRAYASEEDDRTDR